MVVRTNPLVTSQMAWADRDPERGAQFFKKRHQVVGLLVIHISTGYALVHARTHIRTHARTHIHTHTQTGCSAFQSAVVLRLVEASIIDCSSTRIQFFPHAGNCLLCRYTSSQLRQMVLRVVVYFLWPYRERCVVFPSIYPVDRLPGHILDNTFRYQVGWLV